MEGRVGRRGQREVDVRKGGREEGRSMRERQVGGPGREGTKEGGKGWDR